jgi:hypothetical protein
MSLRCQSSGRVGFVFVRMRIKLARDHYGVNVKNTQGMTLLSLGDRLRRVIEVTVGTHKGAIDEYALQIGWKYRTLQDVLGNKRMPGSDLLTQLVERTPRVSVRWLLTGEGAMFPPEPSDDGPAGEMRAWLAEYWATADDEDRTWLKRQFEKAFPEFVIWRSRRQRSEPSPALLRVAEGKKEYEGD